MSRPLRIALLLPLLAGCAAAGVATSPSPAAGAGAPSADAPRGAPATHAPEQLVGGASPRPSEPDTPVHFRPVLVEDGCVDRDLSAPVPDDPALTILDRTYGLPASFVPSDLVPASAAGFDGASGAMLVSDALIEDLVALRAASVAEGLVLQIESGYRSYEDQQATFDDWVARIGPEAAAARTARPGHSEHQLGTALDLVSPGWSGRFGDWAVESAEGAWMAEHGWEHGFVMSYPAGDEASCYGYEPWHYRWIGQAAAAGYRASGLSLRDFLVRYVDR